ncbi:MAG: hypothetical protein CSA18_02900 [Deltaproteobacteria bacterium]|nr:MAG: hypothetical protein CSA18_02900 [Deltaproteobacteria bacterium]
MNKYEISKTGFFSSFDNKNIKYSYHGNGEYKKILIIFQGRAEYLEKYMHIADYYIKKDFLVFLMDWRGQGGSVRELGDPDKGYVSDFKDYQKDIDIFFKEIVAPFSNSFEIYGIAHSMGGHNLFRYIIEKENPIFNKILFCSPMLGINTFPLPQSGAGFIAEKAVKFGFGKKYVIGTGKYKELNFKGNALTSNREKFDENLDFIKKNRNIAIGGPTYFWLYNAFKSMSFIDKNINSMNNNVKTAIVYGSSDRVVSIKKIVNACKYISYDCLEIPDARHEIMMESYKILDIFLKFADIFFDSF